MFSLLSLLDDIATTFDDIAIMSKIAIKKTSALMSDDLAVNAGVIQGVEAHHELPMVWKIFVGSLINKVYCIAGVIAITSVYPPILKWILFVGGIYLAFEGGHKIIEKLTTKSHAKKKEILNIEPEKKIKGAIRTDLILSIEIIVIAKNSLSGPFINQVASLIIVGVLASILIYGLVATLVKIDDLGLHLIKRNYQNIGLALVRSMPYIMKGLGIIGTLAMLLVAGGIFSHTFHLPLYTIELIQNLILGSTVGLAIASLAHLFHRKWHN